jgi:hypothetical protein
MPHVLFAASIPGGVLVRRSAWGLSGREVGKRAGESARDLAGYRLQLRPAGQRDHDLRVERLNDDPVAGGARTVTLVP